MATINKYLLRSPLTILESENNEYMLAMRETEIKRWTTGSMSNPHECQTGIAMLGRYNLPLKQYRDSVAEIHRNFVLHTKGELRVSSASLDILHMGIKSQALRSNPRRLFSCFHTNVCLAFFLTLPVRIRCFQ